MCVAVPARILEINGTDAKAEVSGNIISVNVGLLDCRPGDFVLTHAGLALQVMQEEDAKALEELLKELEEVSHDGR